MSSGVYDSSVILAAIFREPGAEDALKHSDQIILSAVSACEIVQVLCLQGMPEDIAWDELILIAHRMIDFDGIQAKLAGGLAIKTKKLGLSLGDRACLGLGILLKMPVFTMDRAWKNADLGVDVRMLR